MWPGGHESDEVNEIEVGRDGTPTDHADARAAQAPQRAAYAAAKWDRLQAGGGRLVGRYHPFRPGCNHGMQVTAQKQRLVGRYGKVGRVGKVDPSEWSDEHLLGTFTDLPTFRYPDRRRSPSDYQISRPRRSKPTLPDECHE